MLRKQSSSKTVAKRKVKEKVKNELYNKDFFKGCDQLLSYMISKLPESPHKHLKYVHYHNLVYKAIFGGDAQNIRKSRGKNKKELMSDILSELELAICGRAFVDLSNSISRGDSYQESKSLIVEKYGGILVKQ